ncbi:MAG: hypothetical protein AAFY46_03185 [Planctomycetota bacterium]
MALDGRLRPIRGAIALASLARQQGFEGLVLPADNAREASAMAPRIGRSRPSSANSPANRYLR